MDKDIELFTIYAPYYSYHNDNSGTFERKRDKSQNYEFQFIQHIQFVERIKDPIITYSCIVTHIYINIDKNSIDREKMLFFYACNYDDPPFHWWLSQKYIIACSVSKLENIILNFKTIALPEFIKLMNTKIKRDE